MAAGLSGDSRGKEAIYAPLSLRIPGEDEALKEVTLFTKVLAEKLCRFDKTGRMHTTPKTNVEDIQFQDRMGWFKAFGERSALAQATVSR